MSEETGDAEAEAQTEEEKKPGKKRKKRSAKKKSSGKLVLGIVGGVFLFLVGGLGGAYYGGLIHTIMGWEQPQRVAEITLGQPVIHPLPTIRTDLKTGLCRSPFLNATVHVQLAPEYVDRLEDSMDQVMDGILTHLRDQERQHVVGKEGSERLRFELVQIIDNKIQPARVQTVFFKELIVQ